MLVLWQDFQLSECQGMCAGLGAVDPAQGLSFLTALLSSSSRSLAQHSPFLSSHFVYSPFVFARFLSVRGRHSSFFDSFQIETSTVALASITASEAAVAASSRGTVMPGLNEQLQEPGMFRSSSAGLSRTFWVREYPPHNHSWRCVDLP